MEDIAKEMVNMKESITLLKQELKSQAILMKSQNETIVSLRQELQTQSVVMKSQNETIHSLQNKSKRGLMYKPDPPPQFFGDRGGPSAREWLFQTQLYLGLMDDTNYSVQFATTYFRGPAATWWFNKMGAANAEEILALSNWNTFAEILKKEFEPVNPIRVARRRLDELKQRFSVQQYVKDFRDITQQIPGITSEELLHRFITGLKENIKREVDKSEPVDLEIAIRLAEKVDYYEMKSRVKFENPRVERNNATPMELGNLVERRDASKSQKREMLKKQGACFKCEKVGHRARECRAVTNQQPKERL